MVWQKKGLIYVPKGDVWWAVNGYAHVPTVEVLNNELIRVYFDSLDVNKFGRIGYVDLDIAQPERIVEIAQEPIINIGELGTFDDSGVNPCSIINFQGKKFFYYLGWQRSERVPALYFTGLAIDYGDDRGFQKYAKVPVLDRTASEPISRFAPWVIEEDGLLKMWYASSIGWSQRDNHLYYNSVVKYATSKDGVNWESYDYVCLEPDFIDEFAIGRLTVVHDGPLYKMWYTTRSISKSYFIGYAESRDGINWLRKDHEAGIERSESGWDAEMLCYPCVVDVRDKRYLFYNGNHQGASGFGYAVWSD